MADSVSNVGIRITAEGVVETTNGVKMTGEAIGTMGAAAKKASSETATLAAKQNELADSTRRVNAQLFERDVESPFMQGLKREADTLGFTKAKLLEYDVAQKLASEQGKNLAAGFATKIAAYEQEQAMLTKVAEASRVVGQMAGAGITAWATASAALAVQSIDTAASMATLSEKTGITAKDLFALKYAADVSDTSIESLARAMQQIPKSIAEARTAGSAAGRGFAFLQIDPAQLKTQEQAIDAIANAIQRVEDPMAAAAAIQLILKRNGEELLPFFKQGADGIRKLTEEGRKYGELTNENAAAAKAYKDNLVTLNLALSQSARLFSQDLVQGLNAGAEAFLKSWQEGDRLLAVLKGIQGVYSGDAKHQTNVELVALTEKKMLAERQIANITNGVGLYGPKDLAKAQKALAEANARIFELQNLASPRGDPRSFMEEKAPIKGGADLLGREGAAGRDEAERLADKQLAKRLSVMNQEELEAQASDKRIADERERIFAEVARANEASYVISLQNEADLAFATAQAISRNELNELRKREDQKKRLEQETERRAQREMELDQRRTESIERELTSALMRGFERGESGAKLFWTTMKNMAKTVILEPLIKPQMQALATVANEASKGVMGFLKDILSGGGGNVGSDTTEAALLGNSPGGGGFLDTIASFFGGGRASGGSVSAGKIYEVAENGPEMAMVNGRNYFLPGGNGMVTPFAAAQAAAGGGSNVHYAPSITINAPNAAPGVAQELRAMVRDELMRNQRLVAGMVERQANLRGHRLGLAT